MRIQLKLFNLHVVKVLCLKSHFLQILPEIRMAISNMQIRKLKLAIAAKS